MSWTHAQGVNDTLNAGSTSSVANSYGSNVVAGNLLICVVTWINAVSVSSVTDGDSNTWTSTAAAKNPTTNQFLQIWYAIANSSTALTVTANLSGAAIFRGIALEEFNETNGSAVFDATAQQGQSAPGTSADAVTSGNLTVAKADSLLYGFTENASGTDLFSAGTGFAATGTVMIFGATNFGMGEWLTSAAGTNATTFTLSTNNDVWTAAVAFSPAGISPYYKYYYNTMVAE